MKQNRVLPFFFSLVFCFTHLYCYSQKTITISVEGVPENASNVGMRGSVSPLSWQSSMEMKKSGDTYQIELELNESETKEIEYKFVTFKNDSEPTWETTDNRFLRLEDIENVDVILCTWNLLPPLDLSKLKKVSPELLLKDYKLIEQMVLEVHPGTYRYNTKDEINEQLEKLKKTFQDSLSIQEAYVAISRLTASLKCGHTRAGFNNQSRVVQAILHEQKDKILFAFKWLGDEMVVTRNASEVKELKRGTRVLTINSTPVSEIRNQIMNLSAADGATDGNRSFLSESNGYDFRYNSFDVFFHLLFPSEKFELEFQMPDSEEVLRTTVFPLTREERSEILVDRYPDFPKSRNDLWNFTITDDNIGVLEVNSFGLYGWKALTIDYKAFLEDTFAQLNQKEIKHLVIDIRKNTGGNDEMAEELFKYLIKEVEPLEREGRTRYTSFPEGLKSHVDSWGDDPWYFELEPDRTTEDGYYCFTENFENQKLKSKGKVFNGEIFLLTSGANSSLSYYTAARFKLQNVGTIIGQETGGNLNDINGGQILFLRLPHTQIEVDFPVMGGFTLETQKDSGVTPDVITSYTVEDIVTHRDVEMDVVNALIHK